MFYFLKEPYLPNEILVICPVLSPSYFSDIRKLYLVDDKEENWNMNPFCFCFCNDIQKFVFLQMMKKEDRINQLQNDLQESVKELTIIRGILPKITEERDGMWEEVKRHTEKNMLLNSEVSMLKKKMEALDEDILLKEGQISILKDTLGNKSFDLLSSPDRTHEFLLER